MPLIEMRQMTISSHNDVGRWAGWAPVLRGCGEMGTLGVCHSEVVSYAKEM